MAETTDGAKDIREHLSKLKLDRDAPAAPKPSRARWPWVLAAAVVLAGGAFFLTSNQPVPVRLATVEREAPGDVPVLSGSGYVVTAERYVSIGVRVAGRIDRYFVEEGQTVKAGDPLVQLDDRDYRASVARIEAGLQLARANADLARAELQRGRALRKGGVASVQELDVLATKATVAEATIAQLEAELQQARVSLDYTTLRAPTDGVILAKFKEVGEIAVPGGFAGSGDLVRIANLSEMRAEVDINEADLARVKMGQPALVIPDAYNDTRYKAEVVKFYPQVDRQKGTLKVEVRVLEPDAKLLPDMSARISFLRDPKDVAGTTPGMLVPADAIRQDADGYFVWKVANSKVERIAVQPAGTAGGKTRLADELDEGDSVVTGPVELQAAQSVAVTNP